MPRYFFDVHDGFLIKDEIGTDLPGIRAARHEAVQYAASCLRDDRGAFWREQEWHMDVRDDTGLTLFRLTFFATDMCGAPNRP